MSKRLMRAILALAVAGLTIGVAMAGAQSSKNEFDATLERWHQKPEERNDLIDLLDERRRVYEQRLIDLEFDRLGRGL